MYFLMWFGWSDRYSTHWLGQQPGLQCWLVILLSNDSGCQPSLQTSFSQVFTKNQGILNVSRSSESPQHTSRWPGTFYRFCLFACRSGAQGHHVIPILKPINILNQYTYILNMYLCILGKYVTCSITQWQFPMTAAYAFTDYWSQGQTIPVVMVDVAKPPTGKLNLFNLYVALSGSGRSMIQL